VVTAILEEGLQPGILLFEETPLDSGGVYIGARLGIPEFHLDDDQRDVAGLWLSGGPDGVPLPKPLAMATEPAQEGDRVVACGYPFGLSLPRQAGLTQELAGPTFTEGIVSKLLPHPAVPEGHIEVMEFDAAINPGNSGGPLLDQETGQVVGIVLEANTFIGSMRIPTGLGNALPISWSGNILRWFADHFLGDALA
jgi:S1-C subfamily serine protease